MVQKSNLSIGLNSCFSVVKEFPVVTEMEGEIMLLNRRGFFKVCGFGGLAISPFHGSSFCLGGVQNRTPQLLGTARNLIFIHLDGAPSHMDTFDLKTGSWSPDFLGPSRISGYLDWPVGTMPQLAERTDTFSLVRALTGVELVHDRASFKLLTSHLQNPDTQGIVPHFGSLLAQLLEPSRLPEDILPVGVHLKSDRIGTGSLNSNHSLVGIDPAIGKPSHLFHPWDNPDARFERLAQLHQLGNYSENHRNFIGFKQQAMVQASDRRLERLNLDPWPVPGGLAGSHLAWTQQCHSAIRLLNANLGTRMAFLEFGFWDHHDRIYTHLPGRLSDHSRAFDTALSYLLDTLGAAPAQDPAKASLLEETLVVAVGEFGRTPGKLNNSGGRDHWPHAFSALFAGGGVAGGRVIGQTNHDGGLVTDPGWSHSRTMTKSDVLATIFSCLGVDWQGQYSFPPRTTQFDYINTENGDPAFVIDPLF